MENNLISSSFQFKSVQVDVSYVIEIMSLKERQGRKILHFPIQRTFLLVFQNLSKLFLIQHSKKTLLVSPSTSQSWLIVY